MKRTFYVENLGCAKNQVDAEYLIGHLENSFWTLVEDPDDAELIIVNSCGFIDPAKEESIDTTLAFRGKYPKKKILVAGCLSQRYGEDLVELMPEIDGIMGNLDLSQVVTAAESLIEGKRVALIPGSIENGESLQNDISKQYGVKRRKLLSFPGIAYVKIAEGCNNRCTFCAIPLIRGDLRSRRPKEIIDEIQELLSSGVREICLVAQDMGSYGLDFPEEIDLVSLLRDISELTTGQFWLRFLYIHPDRFSQNLLNVCKKDKRILPYFDLPFQHASEDILKRMGRRGNATKYLGLINTIRRELPGSVIRSTFLFGFPGETDDDAEEVFAFLKDAAIDWAGFFTYSREEGTVAADFVDTNLDDKALTELEIASERKKEQAEKLQEPISEHRLDRFVGEVCDVLIEEKVEEEDLYIGRGWFQAPEVDGLIVINADSLEPGQFYRCRIIRRNGIDFEAIVQEEER